MRFRITGNRLLQPLGLLGFYVAGEDVIVIEGPRTRFGASISGYEKNLLMVQYRSH